MNRLIKAMMGDLAEYRPLPFWSWNAQLDEETLKEQIRWMKDAGMGGFFMHARAGLKTPYLSEEWMKCVDVCCKEAEKLGMKAWAYDENGFPSGFVGGKLLEKIEDRDMYLVSQIGSLDAEADVSYLIDGEKAIRVKEGVQEGEEYLNLYIRPSMCSVDILNPEVVGKFLANTHDKYKEHLGENMPKMLGGFFTDEPQYYRWKTPYTPMIAKYFSEQYDEDILDSLALLFVEKEGYRDFRYRYWNGMQKLMLANYGKQLYDWCDANGVKLTGHYVEEVSLGYQMTSCGGVMPFYEYEHIPGIDWLGRDTDNELPPRQVSSVARQMGKKQVLTETFGCCGWDVTPTELCRIAGFQYANGINMICHHLVPYSEHGQRKRDYPAHFLPFNPWVQEHFREFNDYFTRLGYLLGEGEEPVRVAMLHPIRSAYFDYKRMEEAEGFGIRELDQKLREACRMLSSRGIAYHFLDETLLEKHGFVEDKQIGCGQCAYDYLVIPKILTMGKSTEKLIRQYVENGGKVLLLDEAPGYLEGYPHEYPYLCSNCNLEEIVQTQPFEVEYTDTELYYAYRIVNGKPVLFIQNASKNKSYTQTFRFADGSKSFTVLDPISLDKGKLPLTIELAENEAILLLPSQERVMGDDVFEEREFRFQDAEVEFDTNYLTIDTIRYSKDGIEYSEVMYVQEAFQQLLAERYRGKLWLRYDFEIQTLPEQLVLLAEREHTSDYKVNGQEFTYTDIFEDESCLWKADITPYIQEGPNYYETILDWYQSEDTYYALFGENITESLKNCIVYDSEIEAVYLRGKFGVYSHAEYEEHDAETVCGRQFYIGQIPETASELTTDGFPFFRGKIRMSQSVMLDNENIVLKLDGRYLTAVVSVNDNYVGELLFDRRIDLSQYARKGENKLEVEFTIGNRNLMGPFHSAEKEVFVWQGSFEECNIPRSEDGHLRYKLYRFYTDEEAR